VRGTRHGGVISFEVVRDHEIDALLQQCLKTRTQQAGVVELRSKKQSWASLPPHSKRTVAVFC